MADWSGTTQLLARKFTCGFCGSNVASVSGYHHRGQDGSKMSLYICPQCVRPTLFVGSKQQPAPAFGEEISHLPESIRGIYDEARRSFSASAFTGCVMLARALLMHIAVEHGAKPGLKFVQYVNHLVDEGIVPPKKGKDWIDHVRDVGNDANHDITPITAEQAETLLTFLSFVLRFNYELPGKLPAP